MRKINLSKEKAERNKAYAKRFAKTWEEIQDAKKQEKAEKQFGGKFGRWCRIKGHAPNCACVYPTDIVGGKKK